MAEKVHQKTQGFVNDVKAGLHGIHGAGEALRGGTMEALDGVFHKREGEARNHEITERGLAEMRGTEERFEERTHHHHYQPRDDEVSGGGHGFGLGSAGGAGHSHHPQGSHGQGSHFANAHAREAPAGAEYGAATEVGSSEGDGLRAARMAMPGPNKQH